jgi:hypothetical protein
MARAAANPLHAFGLPRKYQPAASFWPALLPAAASVWPPVQVFILACRHQFATALLPGAASFWPALLPPLHHFCLRYCPPLHLFGVPLRYSCSLTGTNIIVCSHAAARCCIHFGLCCCPPLHAFGLSRKYPCSLAGTNVQPNCSPLLHLFGLHCCPPRCILLASHAGIHMCLNMLACRHQSAATLLPAAAYFFSCAVARRCILLASRAGIHARSPAPIYSRAAAHCCIFFSCAVARRCILLASCAGIHARSPAPIYSRAAAHCCIFLACVAARQ